MATAHFKDGAGLFVAYDTEGNKIREVEYKNSEINGKEIYYHADGSVEKIVERKDGKIVEIEE